MEIPQWIIDSLMAYQEDRRPTCGFLQAVLENNLMEAVKRADLQNRELLWRIVLWCYQVLIADCWGSKKAVAEWLKPLQVYQGEHT